MNLNNLNDEYLLFLKRHERYFLKSDNTWTHGGCLTLAFSLREWLDNSYCHNIKILGVFNKQQIEHVVVSFNDQYIIDGYGIHMKDKFLSFYEQKENLLNLRLDRFKMEQAIDNGLVHVDYISQAMIDLLMKEMGPFSSGVEINPFGL